MKHFRAGLCFLMMIWAMAEVEADKKPKAFSSGTHFPEYHDYGSSAPEPDRDDPLHPMLGIPVENRQQMEKKCKNITRIRYGYSAKWTDAPFQVSIRRLDLDRWESFGMGHYCSGSIIANNAILTSGSCLKGQGRAEIGVVVGTLNRRKAILEATQLLFPANIIVHPRYLSENDPRFDIGLVLTSRRMEIGPKVAKIKIDLNAPSARTKCKTYGWGITSEFGADYTDCLQRAALSIVDRRDCRSLTTEYITNSTLCARSSLDSDPCTADLGSPVVCNGKLSGIVTRKDGCEGTAHADTHMSLFQHKQWIKKLLTEYHVRSDDDADSGARLVYTSRIYVAMGVFAFILGTCIF
ncbi:serine protease 1-like [Toxorhynchites rutilus septentrionalis]|uniref:serine protease 1-like n=1 Tax=Toxorhynchites rutilus septentrionalis TaxID=329112 RepID=UPI002479E182|nr:serine protease 1-like [Toxorhynchites rutilus septentrionalis]